MSKGARWLLIFALAVLVSAKADTSVVFNEVMYHPATNEPALEWVELYNQMAVDVDMTGWSIDGGIHFNFPSNTLAKGGGYLVVAISPATLASLTGLTNILGPFLSTNRLGNGGDHLLLRNNSGRVVSELEYGVDGDWPVAPDGSGVSLAKIDRTTATAPAENWTWSAQMGGTPGGDNFPTAAVPTTLVFNEFSPATNAEFWLELMNYGSNNLPLTGYVIVRDGVTNAEYVFPAGAQLGARSFLALTNSTLGFQAVSGDKLFLLPPARDRVVDAVVVKNAGRGRWPDGPGRWLRPAGFTPGSSNTFAFHDEVVINEIMYDHALVFPTNGMAPQVSGEEWLELYNRSTNTVELTGWKLDGGIHYSFPAGKTLAAGAYLVVARDSASLRALYPTIDLLGNFSGKLGRSDDLVVLEDGAGNPANQVHYFDGGRWPEYAAAGGSSLELRNPWADNAQAEAWAASDESAKGVWITNRYQMVAATPPNANWPTLWNDFVMGLLGPGECLIDDISVVESPDGAGTQFIANGNFENGQTGWRMLGTHIQSRVEAEPGNAANHVLHVIATGAQEDVHNHIETTYTSKKTVTDGQTYEISYRAKWIAGNNLLNTRLYYDRVASTTVLPRPSLNGTPGTQNSRYAARIGPTFTQFQHQPVVPAASQAVTVSVAAQDPQEVTNCEVWWSKNGAAFSHAAMTKQASGLYSGAIPGAAAGSIVQFYVRAADSTGAVATYPARGAAGGAFYMVADGLADLNLGHNLRVIMTPANWRLMRANTNLMSSAFVPGTVIYDEQRPYYDMGVRLKGSQSGRVNDQRPSFHLEFRPDDLFRGVHSVMMVDASGRPGSANQQEEILVHHMALHAGGIPDLQMDLCRLIPMFSSNTGPAVLTPRFEDEFIETAYANGGDGTEWALELTYYPLSANSAGYKLPSPQNYVGVDIADFGDDKETYRYNFIIKNHRDADDYSRLLAFARALSLPNGPELDALSRQLIDMDEWLRMFTLISLVGEGDWYTFGNSHNLLMYNRPSDHRMVAFPTDVEQLFLRPASSSLIGIQNNWTDIENYPVNARRIYAHALDIIATTFNTDYMTYWTSHYESFAPGQDYSDLLAWIPQRTAAVLDEIDSAGGNAPFSITSTNLIVTSSNLVEISGTAPVQVQSIRINGIEYHIDWTTISNWTILVPISVATNALNVSTADFYGNALTNFTGLVNLDFTGILPSPVGTVVIDEIMYNPAVSNACYIELRNTSTTASFDLSGWRLHGVDYTFPPGSFLTNQQIMVLAQDQSAFLTAYGNTNLPFDVYHGALQAAGETLALLAPGSGTNAGAIIDKVRYSAYAPWPSNDFGSSLQLVDAAQENSRVANWAAAPGTPCADNAVTDVLPPFPPLWLNELQAENLTSITNRAGQRVPWMELFNPSTNTVALTNLYLANSYNDLTAWAFPDGATIGPREFKIIFADGQTNLTTANEWHANFSLAPGFGGLALSRLYNSQPQVLDFMDYTNLAPNRSFGSLPDGQNFERRAFFYVTPGATNDGRSAPLTVVINEWMAGNTHTLTNPVNNKCSDWFELYNYGTNAADLSGYYVTDNLTNKFKSAIPAGYSIPPQSFLLVWADSKVTNGTPDLHANFKLSKAGGSIGLYGVDGAPVDFLDYGLQADDVSEGRYPDAAPARYFMPTATARTNNVIPNTAPFLLPIPDQVVYYGQALHLTAAAADAESAVQTLTFSVDPGAPAGAAIDPMSGYFTLQAVDVPAPGTNSITIRVTDNGTPPLSAASTFLVGVLPPPQLNALIPAGQFLTLSFGTLPGQNYQVEYKEDLGDPAWLPLNSAMPGTGGSLEIIEDVTAHNARFYRLTVVP